MSRPGRQVHRRPPDFDRPDLRHRQLELIGIAQTNKWSNLPRGTGTAIDWREKKDGYNFLVGATYDFGVAKVYATGEYDHHMRIKASDNTTLKVV